MTQLASKQRTSLALRLAESGIMLALATVLSLLKLADLPYGGSITPASMFPILLIAYRHGTGHGLLVATLYGAIQQLLGLNTLSYFSTWYSIVAIILLDYVVAFAVAGLGGIFKKKLKSQALALVLGALLVTVLRYLCHVISGCTVWAGMSIPTQAALIYSFIYNATYMLPEGIILVLAAYYLGSCLDFSKKLPVRVRRFAIPACDWLTIAGGGALLAALAYDVAKVFSLLQDGETGEFTLTVLTSASMDFFLPLIVVSLAGIFLCALCFGVAAMLSKKKGKGSV
ncbi:MAG: energy-coupled thiamine transporter ThiT [Clostridia bacterium]|nr:energy-coupled thiamine transporter ThiT [Clostridia bacterium]MBQ8235705.1 energy-coupled thiamine transporter ThiT [Clostridia bacterium]MBQ8399484.1 energy-coupled thiamine transporter ThiT [Clostridia bacterium]